jgi:RHS repeat-associated protein
MYGAAASDRISSTSYTWDSADNRLSKTVAISTNSTVLTALTVVYTNNSLNQLLGYSEVDSASSVTSVVNFSYDPNGARTNKTSVTTEGTEVTEYVYDEDNRLIQVVASAPSVASVVNSFSYDYRSRRYFRSTPTETNLCVFDGGLAIQEYDATSNSQPQTSNLRTEYTRGEGMGGGVGGMVYSIKHTQASGLPPQTSIICSHANHRGDIIARSSDTGSLTSFALYEAYGTRPTEWSDGVTGDPDRQKANTKEEETDLGLLNEGMRYRDLETGTFLTRDPIGYADGPNVYCYVHCNPITKFDAFGLSETGDELQQKVVEKVVETDTIVDDVAGGLLNAVITAVDGLITAPKTIKDQVYEFGCNPSLATLPIIGPAGVALGEAGSNLMNDPTDPVNIVSAIGAGANAVAVTAGSVQGARMAGVPGTKGTTAPASSTSEAQSSLTTSATDAAKSVSTEHGPAIQSPTVEAQAALRQAQSGAPVYRAGRLGTQHGAEGQFWSFQNPASTPGYTGQMGMPGGGAGEPFIIGGCVNPVSPVITRPAPGIGANAGGAMEAVTPSGGVTLGWFHMP